MRATFESSTVNAGRINAAVFDLDGTLVDSHRDIAGALNEVLASLGAPTHADEAVKRMIGGGAKRLIQRALPDQSMFEAARARFYDAYRRRLLDTTNFYDGISGVLERLKAAGVTTAIATNKPAAFTRPIVAQLPIHVDAWASGDEVENKKPDPAVVRLALERAGLVEPNLRRVAYVGDMPVDHETSNRLGVRFIGVAWGFDPTGLAATKPAHLVTTAAELEDALFTPPPAS